jgi:hypothetical protein
MVDTSMHVDEIRLLAGGRPRTEARKVSLHALERWEEHETESAPPQVLGVRALEVIDVQKAVGQLVAHVGPELLDKQASEVEHEVAPEDAFCFVHVQQCSEDTLLLDIAHVDLARDDTGFLQDDAHGIFDLRCQQRDCDKEIAIHACIHAAGEDLLAADGDKRVVGREGTPVIQPNHMV